MGKRPTLADFEAEIEADAIDRARSFNMEAIKRKSAKEPLPEFDPNDYSEGDEDDRNE